VINECESTQVHTPRGDSTLLFQNCTRYSGRIPMVRGGGSRPRVAPRTPARAPRATRAYTRRAFPPETSEPGTGPARVYARAELHPWIHHPPGEGRPSKDFSVQKWCQKKRKGEKPPGRSGWMTSHTTWFKPTSDPLLRGLLSTGDPFYQVKVRCVGPSPGATGGCFASRWARTRTHGTRLADGPPWPAGSHP
jgi:hypothetical protein